MMSLQADEWPTIFPKRALNYFQVMCVKWMDVKTDIQRLGHVHELSGLLPPTATRINLNVVSQTNLELVYNLGKKTYRVTGKVTDGSLRTSLDEVREVVLGDSATEIQ